MLAGHERAAQRASRMALAVTFAVLVLSWIALYIVLSLATLSLAPYDSSWYDYWGWPTDSPPPGSWQRSMNAFFEKPPGSVLPAAMVVGASVACYAAAHRRTRNDQVAAHLRLAVGYSVSNLIIASAVLFDHLVIDWPLEVGPAPGYDWTVQFLLPDALLVTTLLVLQLWGIPWLMRAHFPGRLHEKPR